MNFSYKLYKNMFDHCLIKQIADNLKSHNNKEYFIYEDDNNTVRSIFSPHKLDKDIYKFAYQNSIIPEVKNILGKDIYLHQAHFNYKSAHTGGAYGWHSDYTFWKAHDGMNTTNAVSVLFMLDDMTEENGALEILPGSENFLVEKKNTNWTIKHDEHETDGMITEDMVSLTQLQRHTVQANAGDVLVMHSNMWHCSKANTSNEDRNVLFLCYNRLDNATTKYDRPDYITLRDFNLI